MAYENTSVAVSKSQDGIRKLILGNGGAAVAFISQPPREGFEAQIIIEGKTYRVRIVAECVPKDRKRRRSRRYGVPNRHDLMEEEARRVWRVLFYHLKSVYEAANSGVMEFRELMLPYIVTHDGHTVAEHILPKLAEAIAGNSSRLLPAHKPEER
jgi:hypothetical protein